MVECLTWTGDADIAPEVRIERKIRFLLFRLPGLFRSIGKSFGLPYRIKQPSCFLRVVLPVFYLILLAEPIGIEIFKAERAVKVFCRSVSFDYLEVGRRGSLAGSGA